MAQIFLAFLWVAISSAINLSPDPISSIAGMHITIESTESILSLTMVFSAPPSKVFGL